MDKEAMTSTGNRPPANEHPPPRAIQNSVSTSPTPELTEDAFLGGRLTVLQPKATYRAGIDAVLLAAAPNTEGTASKNSQRKFKVIDAGSGVGTVGLCLAHRLRHADVTMLEKNAQLSAIATTNIQNNNMSERARALCADVTAPAAQLAAQGIAENEFDCVLSNPPYHSRAAASPAKNTIKQHAHAMDEKDLDRWFRFMTRALKPRGTAIVIHKASHLDRVLNALAQRFGGIEVLTIHPRPSEPANRVIVKGTKGSRAELKILPPLVIHEPDNSYTPTVENVLRHGAGLDVFSN